MSSSEFPSSESTPPTLPPARSAYELCEQCGAPLDAAQRYCVVCATRRKHVADPAARFMSTATSRARSQARRAQSGAGATGGSAPRASSLGTALVIALIPLGVLLGVLVGHGSNGPSSKELAAVLKAEAHQTQTVAAVSTPAGGGAVTTTPTGGAATASTVDVSTTFPLVSGYAVELSTLPSGTSTSAASAAVAGAKAKGATGVGVIGASAYAISPAPAGGAAFILYAGADKSRSAVEATLAKLKHAFPHASLISVKSSQAGGGKVISKTVYGSATAATDYNATAADKAAGANDAKNVAKKIGSNYVGAQKGLPSVVSVP